MSDPSNGSNKDDEYNGIEWDDAYDPDSDYWTDNDKPEDSDKEWDGGGDTSADNTWNARATTGKAAPRDETKEQRKLRLKEERRAEWAKALREAEIEKEQKKLKREELARIGREERAKRAAEAKREAEKRGFKVEDWEVEFAKTDTPKAQKERSIAKAIVGVGVVTALVGGIVGWNASPDAEVIVETQKEYIDLTPSVDTRANNRAKEMLAERGHSTVDDETMGHCIQAVQRGMEVRNYYERYDSVSGETAEHIRTLYAISMSQDVDLQELNDARVNLRGLSTREYGATARAIRMIRDFNYYAEKCGVDSESEFSDPPVENRDTSYLDRADAEFDRLNPDEARSVRAENDSVFNEGVNLADVAEFDDIDETGFYDGSENYDSVDTYGN